MIIGHGVVHVDLIGVEIKLTKMEKTKRESFPLKSGTRSSLLRLAKDQQDNGEAKTETGNFSSKRQESKSSRAGFNDRSRSFAKARRRRSMKFPTGSYDRSIGRRSIVLEGIRGMPTKGEWRRWRSVFG